MLLAREKPQVKKKSIFHFCAKTCVCSSCCVEISRFSFLSAHNLNLSSEFVCTQFSNDLSFFNSGNFSCKFLIDNLKLNIIYIRHLHDIRKRMPSNLPIFNDLPNISLWFSIDLLVDQSVNNENSSILRAIENCKFYKIVNDIIYWNS